MATRVKPVKQQHPGLLSAWKSCIPSTTLEELHMAKLQTCLCYHGYNISILTSEPFNEIGQKAICPSNMQFMLLQIPEYKSIYQLPWQQDLHDSKYY